MYLGVRHRFKLTNTCIVQRSTTRTYTNRQAESTVLSWPCRDTEEIHMPAVHRGLAHDVDAQLNNHIRHNGFRHDLPPLLLTLLVDLWGVTFPWWISPAGRLKGSGCVGGEAGVRAGGFRVDRPTVVVSVVVSSLLVANHLERLTEVHQGGREPRQPSHPLKERGRKNVEFFFQSSVCVCWIFPATLCRSIRL